MNLILSTKTTYSIFVKNAYPLGTPPHIHKKFKAIENIATINELLEWSAYEMAGNRYNLRIGNHIFPHMKLSFIFEKSGPMYYVDCHDKHFNVPLDSPEFTLLQKMRDENLRLKKIIEKEWEEAGINIFGSNVEKKLPPRSEIGKGMTILAIDDEGPILELIGHICNNINAKYFGCQNLKEAKNSITDDSMPDLIFCDIRMRHGECGYDFVQWYRKKGYNTPIFYVTGMPKSEVNDKNVTGVVQKPFSNHTLMTIISNQANNSIKK